MPQESEVPEGWKVIKLSVLGEITTGNTPPKKDPANFGNEYPWVKPSDLKSDDPITKTEQYLSEKGASVARLLPVNAVLVSCIGNLGKVGIAGVQLATNQQINSISFDERVILPKYGYYFCKTLKKWLEDNSSATTIQIINKSRFSEAPILLPPLPEQHRIVAAIEALFARLDTANARLERVPGILKQFRQAVLAAACDGRLTEDWRAENPDIEDAQIAFDHVLAEKRKLWENIRSNNYRRRNISQPVLVNNPELPELPNKWTWSYLGQITDTSKNSITDGPFGSKLKTEHYTDSGPRVIRLQNIGDGFFIDEVAHISHEHYLSLEKHWVFSNDIVIGTLGNPLPRACVTPSNVGPAIVKADCIRLKSHALLADHRYLVFAINNTSTRKRMLEAVHGVGRERLNLAEIKSMAIPLPPLPEQNEIVHRVNVLFALADQIEAEVAAARAKTETMRQSILAQAFSGRLVPTEAELARQEGRDYEPASVLLERIHSEKTEKKRGRKAQSTLI